MGFPTASRALLALLTGALLSACATQGGGEKGAVLLDLPAGRVSKALEPRRIALLVGIQQFDDPRWRPLRYPRADADAFAAVLRDPERGHFDQVEVVAPGATRDELRAALRRLAASSADDRDTVVLYVSTHGTLARDGRGELRRYLVARDTRVDAVAETGLPLSEVKGEFDRLRSRRKVLVLAACHSGGGKSLLPADLEGELAGTKSGFFVQPIEEASRASMVLAASAWGETAREDERLGNDIYTHFLVQALTVGADRNGDGVVTASEAHDYARRMTYEYTGGRQRPTAETEEIGADPVVLVGRRNGRGRPELFSYAGRFDGFTVRVDGKPLAELPGGLALDAGAHHIQVAKGDAEPLLDQRLSLEPGERIDLASLVNRSAGRWEVAPRLAFVGFLDRRSREDVLGPVTAGGATAALREWPAPGMELRADAVYSSGRSTLAISGGPTVVGYDLLAAGVALPWRFRPGLARTELFAGPRLSGLLIRRRFDLSPSPGVAQSWFTFMPGMVAGVDVQLTRQLSFTVEAHLDWTLMRIDGADRSTGLAEGLAGFGWRF